MVPWWASRSGGDLLRSGFSCFALMDRLQRLGYGELRRKHRIDLGRRRRCRRPWMSLPSLEALSRSSFTFLVVLSLRLFG
jgi:hypothetical protein